MSNTTAYSRSAFVPPKINRPKVRLRVSYNLQSNTPQSNRHCFGINSLAQNNNEGWLFTAGRDSTIRCWDINTVPIPAHIKSFEHHIDWVNDIFLCNNSKTLVSCSSDAAIKIWDTETTECIRTLSRHGDYVKAMSYAPEANVFVSTGLDSNIFIWDINQCVVPVTSMAMPAISSSSAPSTPTLNSSSGFRNNVAPIVRTGCDKGSIYSVGINSAGTLVMTGSTETIVRGWDPRSGQKTFKLKGHNDNIKALIMNAEGTLCLTGSSDFTIRLWDIGQQRCVHVFEVHDDSIWALAADPSFTHFFSGSRDGAVFTTDLATSKSVYLFTEPQPVLKLLHSTYKEEALWVTTTDSSIKKWSIDGLDIAHAKQRRSYVPPPILSSSPTTTVLQGPRPQPLVTTPTSTIPGRPGMVKHHILNNRRHVLTKDSSGGIELWDVTKGEQIACCTDKNGVPVTFESKCEELTEMVSLPTWFSVDTKTGSIAVHLDFPQCFNAEVYAGDAGMDIAPEDEEIQINLGERVLRALFTNWLQGRKEIEAKQREAHSNGKDTESQPRKSSFTSNDKQAESEGGSTVEKDYDKDKEKERDKDKTLGKSGSLQKSDRSVVPPNSSQTPRSPQAHSRNNSTASNGSAQDSNAPVERQRPLPQFSMPPNISITISEEGTGATMHRSLLSQFDGAEPNEIIPQWVVECLLNNDVPSREAPKIGFHLVTTDEKECPALPQGNNRLSAHKLLKIRKVANFVVQKLELELPPKNKTEIAEISNGNHDDSSSSTSSEDNNANNINGKSQEEKVAPEQYIEILCNNKVLPVNINLATVKAFFWKSGDDLMLQYRINPEYINETGDKKGAKGSKGKKSKMPKLHKSSLLHKSKS